MRMMRPMLVLLCLMRLERLEVVVVASPAWFLIQTEDSGQLTT
jgi:hypothetical protein